MYKSSQVLTLIAALSLVLLPAATAQSQPAVSDSCVFDLDNCSVNCLGLEDPAKVETCMIGCSNAAATYSPDEKPTLDSEEFLARWGEDPFAKAGACHSTTPCPSEYASCGSWSGYSDCGDPYCGVYRTCGAPCPEYPFCFGEATRQARERFRVCFNQQAQSCTEYQRTSIVLYCGC
jgi:hypothetical protein